MPSRFDFVGDRLACKPARRGHTLAEALDVALESRGRDEDRLPQATENIVGVLSRMIVALHDKGVLSDDEVATILGIGFSKAAQPHDDRHLPEGAEECGGMP